VSRAVRRFELHQGGQSAVYADPARFKVLACGRRWGKTDLAVVVLLAAALALEGLYRYIGPSFTSARRQFWRRKLKRRLDPSWLLRPINETRMEVELFNGSIIECMGAEDPDALKGEGVAGAVLDECATILERRPETWAEAVRPSLADVEGWALLMGTPKAHNGFYNLHQLGLRGLHGFRAWQFPSATNPFLKAEEIAHAKATTDERTYRQEWEASFEALAGRAYYAFERALHYYLGGVPVDRFVPMCVSFDFNVNPATAILGQKVGNEARVWREVFLVNRGGEATRAAALAAKALLTDIGWKGPIRIYGDASGRAKKTTGPADHAVLREVFPGAHWRIPDENPHVRDRIAAVNSRLKTIDGKIHMVIDPTCEHLMTDFDRVTMKNTGELDEGPDKMLGHITAALGYWLARDFPAVKGSGALFADVPGVIV
jgi:hypothetical protein